MEEDALIQHLFAEQWRIARSAALWLAMYILASTAGWAWIDLNHPGDSKLMLLGSLADFAVLYLLLIATMQLAGYFPEGKRGGLWLYVVVGLLVGLATVGGLIALIVPGLYLAARFAPAMPNALADGGGAFQITKRAWLQTRGHAGSIMLSMAGAFALLLVMMALFIVEYSVPAELGEALVVGANLAGSLASIWLIVSQVAVRRVIPPASRAG